jgi:hypothetical protein
MERFLGDFETRRAKDLPLMSLYPSRVFDILQAGSTSRLSRIISVLIAGRVFRRQIVVRFPFGNGTTFASYTELSAIVRDPVKDVDVEEPKRILSHLISW